MRLDDAIPAEMQLLIAAARAPLGETYIHQIRKMADGDLDWGKLTSLAERHQVTPLLLKSLNASGLKTIPSQTWRELGVKSLTTAHRNRLFADELVRLNNLLKNEGYHVISYKGPIAAAILYGDLDLRAFGDMDFLVRRSELDAVCDLLSHEGYTKGEDLSGQEKTITEREQKEYCFVKGPIMLEPHWSITARRFPFDIHYPSLWERAHEVEFNGSRCLTFSPEDMLLILCVCGCKGRWHRLQMVTDVAQAISCYIKLDWGECIARAEQSRSGRRLRLGLLLANTVMNADLPEEIMNYCHHDMVAAEIAKEVIESWYATRKNFRKRRDPALFSAMLFRMLDTPNDKLRYLVRTTTTPRNSHLRRLPLSDQFFWLYRIFVPLHDYIAKPLVHFLRRRS